MPRLGEESRDIEAIRAINAARYAQPRGGSRTGRFPHASWVYTARNGLTVRPYRPRNIYANSISPKAKFSHMTRFGWKAYDDRGRVRLTVIRYLCGQTSHNAVTSATPELPVCAKCRLAFVGHDRAVEALDALAQD